MLEEINHSDHTTKDKLWHIVTIRTEPNLRTRPFAEDPDPEPVQIFFFLNIFQMFESPAFAESFSFPILFLLFILNHFFYRPDIFST